MKIILISLFCIISAAVAQSNAHSVGKNEATPSDRRFKSNVSQITKPIDKLKQIEGVTYTYDRDSYPTKNFPEGKQIGVIAQEVENVIPEVVYTDAEGYKSVAYDKLTAVLIEATKEQQVQIEKLQSENAQLKNDLAAIKAKLGIY